MGVLLEELAKKNAKNYAQYIERMSSSITGSSKWLIPTFTRKSKSILDVGCANGALLKVIRELNPDAELTGIDVNSEALKKTDTTRNIKLENKTLFEVAQEGRKFDCIIFSSVLHEISSYDLEAPFTAGPIEKTIKTAHSMLNDDGKLIIRDGLASHKTTITRVCFRNKNDINWVSRYANEFYKPIQYQLGSNSAMMNWRDLKEFFFKYTWGPESWNREIKEQYGIITKAEWFSLVQQCGFVTTLRAVNAEEYVEYLNKKVIITPELEKLMQNMTVLIVAKKIMN